jgi:hypothetical protein
MNLLEKWKFKRAFKSKYVFVYDKSTGQGLKPLQYYFFSDLVRFRISQFGSYSIGSHYGQFLPREKFHNFYINARWEK